MSAKQIEMYDNKVWGVEVSKYGLENGYLDYQTMSKILGDCILNNVLRAETIGVIGEWEMVAGEFDRQIFQDYIITEYGYRFLEEYTDEIVFYNEQLDIYIWSVTHFGTSWDYVLTDIELIDMG